MSTSQQQPTLSDQQRKDQKLEILTLKRHTDLSDQVIAQELNTTVQDVQQVVEEERVAIAAAEEAERNSLPKYHGHYMRTQNEQR
ncbi:hypothetical protein LTR05_005672 [Lithohypha guttulata]|uniref:Uncharacterized protein n=1 Tax=Lithohypha guttulata TaxID=1690604 RepID=A0AAN7Y655_9EURO|nr:hypothetical protein LTR05_005672 [Lithohypha guttulata]